MQPPSPSDIHDASRRGPELTELGSLRGVCDNVVLVWSKNSCSVLVIFEQPSEPMLALDSGIPIGIRLLDL
jgi:hypothetical protein